METRNENRRKRRFLVLLLIFALVGVLTGGIYSYWAGSISNPSNETNSQVVIVGEGKDVSTSINLTKELASSGKKLVPNGKVEFSKGGSAGNVDSFVIKYKVKWVDAQNIVKSADNVLGNLTITPKVVLKGKDASDLSSKINVAVATSPSTIKLNDASTVDVSLTVTMLEPANLAEYTNIIGGNITIDTTFAVAKQ